MPTPALRRDVQLWSPVPSADDPLLKISWTRAATALRRSKWLIGFVVLLGLLAGIAATRLAAPVYVAQARLWIANDAPVDEGRGASPIRTAALMRETAWPELLTSFAVLDSVVLKTSLNLVVPKEADAPLFVGFNASDVVRTGDYELRVDKSGWQYQLLDGSGKAVQSGILGDSIGRAVGMRWKPNAAATTPGRVVKFTLLTTREAAQRLRRNMTLTFDAQSGLLGVTLKGSEPARTATILKAIVDEFRLLAAQLKSRNASEVTKVLKEQLDYEERALRTTEAELERFRVQQATVLGTEAPSSDTTGAARNSVFESYLRQEFERDSLRRERQAVVRAVSAVRAGTIEPQALWMIPTIRSVAAPELRTEIAALDSTESRLARAAERYTDDHTIVQQLRAQIADLRSSRIPRAVDGVINELARREHESDAQVGTLTERLRTMPAQNTQEARLRRDVEAHAALYGTLRRRYDEALLAQTGATPDISVLDPVVAPDKPSSDKLPFVIILALLLSGAAGIAIALGRDRLDSRFRYPEQAIDELGLDVVGALPALERSELADGGQAQVTEAFRTLRMTIKNVLAGEGPVTLAITSPAPADGKSFVSANLALSFAAAGLQTVLLDADLRRGNLHARFGVDPTPGIVDWLGGSATLDDVLRDTTQDKLTILPRGTFQLAAPQLLLGDRIKDLMSELQQRFAAVIVDCPPLGAGVDPLALGAAAGNLLLVLRSGQTDRRAAQAHMKLLSRLPIRIVGTVLNGVPDTGAYQYYGYMDSDLRGKGSELPELARQAADFAQRSGLSF